MRSRLRELSHERQVLVRADRIDDDPAPGIVVRINDNGLHAERFDRAHGLVDLTLGVAELGEHRVLDDDQHGIVEVEPEVTGKLRFV